VKLKTITEIVTTVN